MFLNKKCEKFDLRPNQKTLIFLSYCHIFLYLISCFSEKIVDLQLNGAEQLIVKVTSMSLIPLQMLQQSDVDSYTQHLKSILNDNFLFPMLVLPWIMTESIKRMQKLIFFKMVWTHINLFHICCSKTCQIILWVFVSGLLCENG